MLLKNLISKKSSRSVSINLSFRIDEVQLSVKNDLPQSEERGNKDSYGK